MSIRPSPLMSAPVFRRSGLSGAERGPGDVLARHNGNHSTVVYRGLESGVGRAEGAFSRLFGQSNTLRLRPGAASCPDRRSNSIRRAPCQVHDVTS